jgi:hypothetical protein
MQGRADGIGLMMLGLSAEELTAIDLDKVRNPATGEIVKWARDLIQKAASYAEHTPSGTGERILGWSTIGSIHRNIQHPSRIGSFELYANTARYVTVSAHTVNGYTEFRDITAAVEELKMLDGRKGANGAADDPDFDPGEAQPIDLQTLPLMIVELITHGTLDGVKIRKRGPHFMRVVRRLHKFGFASALTLLAEHPNGVQGKYIEGGRLETELRRVWDKVETSDNRPTIVVSGGKRHENADAGIDALQQARIGALPPR